MDNHGGVRVRDDTYPFLRCLFYNFLLLFQQRIQPLHNGRFRLDEPLLGVRHLEAVQEAVIFAFHKRKVLFILGVGSGLK